jgi:hypothetical protein
MKPQTNNKIKTEEDISVSFPWMLSYELCPDIFVWYINKKTTEIELINSFELIRLQDEHIHISY